MLREAEDDDASEPRIWGSLPLHGNVRWTPWRKRDVVLAIRNGAITANEALERYRLSREELTDWMEGFEQHGIAGLHLKCKRWVCRR
jgi:hypothetical protein